MLSPLNLSGELVSDYRRRMGALDALERTLLLLGIITLSIYLYNADTIYLALYDLSETFIYDMTLFCFLTHIYI
jgi:hypothetical protein